MHGTNIEDAATVSMTITAGDSVEVCAYTVSARRGDVLPVCMRLTAARADAEWTLRASLVRQAGPASPQESLDRACDFMPDAPEPRLLRAARSIAIAATTSCACTRSQWLTFAHDDLVTAARLDPMDPTARGMLADLVGASAWAAQICRAA
jgi:hypothetical protein